MAEAIDPASRRALSDARPTPFWLDDPAAPEPAAALAGSTHAELVIVGGGFTGLWAAVEAKERDPGRDVLLLDGGTLGSGASGRNGGFLSSSLTHGLPNGLERFPDEIEEIERQARENFASIHQAIQRYEIDAEWEARPVVILAARQHQTSWFPEAVRLNERFGYEAQILGLDELRDLIRSPVYIGGIRFLGDHALVHPAKLAWGLGAAATRLGVRIAERTPVRSLDAEAGHLSMLTDHGSVTADRVILATNAFPPLLPKLRRRIVPVYDHVLMTEPLTHEQREAIGWRGREGLSEAANRFHYFRLSADDRILWGGYDATYHFGNAVRPSLEQNDAVHGRLAANFFATFPMLEGIRFSHRWGGVIDTCSRFSVMFETAFDGRVASAVGYTGLGVGATRFGACTSLDLVDGLRTERTELQMVRSRPLPFPPEPARWLSIRATIRSYDREDRTGKRGKWLRLLDRLGLGFQS